MNQYTHNQGSDKALRRTVGLHLLLALLFCVSVGIKPVFPESDPDASMQTQSEEQTQTDAVEASEEESGLSSQGLSTLSAEVDSEVKEFLFSSADQVRYQDIDPSQGSVQLGETDLALPGKNGLNLVLKRVYNSKNYMNTNQFKFLSNKPWGGFLGHGWQLMPFQRAYYVRNTKSDNKINKVVIESAAGAETYDFNEETSDYRSDNPKNFNKVTITQESNNVIIVLLDTQGHRIVFGEETSQLVYNREANMGGWETEISGGYISSISDSYNHTIRFQYRPVDAYVPIDNIEDYVDLGDGMSITKGASYRFYQKVPDTITDTYGRVITFHAEKNTEWDNENNQFQLTGLSYTNVNGTTSTIEYDYDNQGRLIQAGIEGLPHKTYTYIDYETSYDQYSYHERHCSGSFITSCYDDYYYIPGYGEDRTGYDDKSIEKTYDDELKGSLLEKIISPLGNIIQYEYEEAYSEIKLPRHKERQHHGRHDKYYITNVYISSAHPVVSKKNVYESEHDTAPKSYAFLYPLRSNGTHVKAEYKPFWIDDEEARGFYFDKVTVITPDELPDIELEFFNGLPIKESKTVEGVVYDTITSWNYETNNKLYEKTYLNNTLQMQVLYSNYDAYHHPRTIESYKGTEKLLTTETYYKTGDTFVNNNWVHLIDKKLVSDGAKTKGQKFEYNDHGQAIEVYKLNESGVLKKRNGVSYDSEGRVISNTSYNGPSGSLTQSTSYTGGENGAALVITQTVNGKQTSNTYEFNTGKQISATDINAQTATTEYDNYGRVIQQTYPNGTSVHYAYAQNLLSFSETFLGNTTTTYTDTFGRITEIDYPEGQQDVSYTYYIGDKVKETYKKENGMWMLQEKVTYDQGLRPIESEHPDWGILRTSYDDAQHKVTHTDYIGRNTTTYTNELGQTTQTVYEPDGSTTQYNYDNFGNLIQTIDAKGLVHENEYDNEGKVTKRYNTYKQGPKTLQKEWTYYENGQINSVSTYKDGLLHDTQTYVYDNENRIQQLKKDKDITETFQYDQGTYGKNQLTQVETEDVTTAYEFDAFGRPTKETTTIKSIGKTHAIRTSYTDTDQVKTITYNDGKVIEYSYDSLHRLKTIHYDGHDILTYYYNENATLDYLEYGNGITLDYTYENEEESPIHKREGYLTEIEAIANSNTTLFQETYAFDTVGNLDTLTTQHPITDEPGTKHYTYSEKNELTTIGLTASSHTDDTYKTYAYDENGNITTFSLPGKHNNPRTTQRQFNEEKDQLTRLTQDDGSYYTFNFDERGNLIQKILYNADNTLNTQTDYTFNYQNQLQEVKKDTHTLATYQYNHKRLRVYSNTNIDSDWGGEKIYYWSLGGQEIGEGNLKYGDHTVRYIYNGNEKIAMIRPKNKENLSEGESIYWFINTSQGTPIKIVDEKGGVVDTNQVDEWGNPPEIMTGNPVETNFTGKKYDPVTGLYYFHQRYYDPALGIFIQPDPAGQYLNPYTYGPNNPLMYVDPDGEFFSELFSVFGPIGSIIGALLDTAAVEAARSAAINVTMQWAFNGGVNWEDVGTSALRGGAMAGLFGTGVDWDTGSMLKDIGYNAIESGVRNVAYDWISGKGMSQDDMWDSFSQGAGMGAISGSLKTFYRSQVGYGVDYGPGEGQADKVAMNPPKGRGIAVKGVNNLGFANGAPHGANWFRENTTFLSNFLNKWVPGANAVGGLHDAWGRYDWLYDGFLNSGGLIGASGTVWNLAGAMGVVYWSASIDYHYVY